MSLASREGRGRRARLAASLGAAALAFGCVAQEIVSLGDVAGIRVSPDTIALRVGDSSMVHAAALDASATWLVLETALWRSSAAGVATVDSTGRVLGVASGMATLTGSIGTHEGTTVVIVSGNPSVLTREAGDGQSAEVNAAVLIAPAVRVVDASANPVPGVEVTFTPAAGSGAVGPFAAVRTGYNGVARVGSWTLGSGAGPHTLTASVVGALNSVTFAATATVGPPDAQRSTIAVSETAIVPSSGQSFTTVTVTVRDAASRTVQGATVVLSATGAGAVVTQPTAPTNALGQTTGTVSSTAGGSITIRATVNGATTLTQTASVDVTSNVPAGLVVAVQPAGALSGDTFGTQPVVEIRDGFGNRVLTASNPVTVALVSGDGTLMSGGSFTVNAVNGRATFAGLGIRGSNVARDTLGTGKHVLQFSATGFTSVRTDTLNVEVSFNYNVVDIYNKAGCTACHGFTYANTLNQPSTLAPCAARPRIVPFDTLNSFIYEKIRRPVPACGEVMPPGGLPQLSANLLRIVRDWILQGAKLN